MIPTGTITKIEGKFACVSLVRQSACQSCRACSLGQSENKEMEIRAVNEADGQIGDLVELDLRGETGLQAALITYTIPLITLFLGYILLEKATGFLPYETSQAIAAISCIILAFLAFFALRLIEPNLRSRGSFTPTIRTIIS
jgi:sigma-E factor negative regulatory protein RseC